MKMSCMKMVLISTQPCKTKRYCELKVFKVRIAMNCTNCTNLQRKYELQRQNDDNAYNIMIYK